VVSQPYNLWGYTGFNRLPSWRDNHSNYYSVLITAYSIKFHYCSIHYRFNYKSIKAKKELNQASKYYAIDDTFRFSFCF